MERNMYGQHNQDRSNTLAFLVLLRACSQQSSEYHYLVHALNISKLEQNREITDNNYF